MIHRMRSVLLLVVIVSLVSLGYAQKMDCKFKLERCESNVATIGKKYKDGFPICSNSKTYQFGILRDGSALVICKDNKMMWSESLVRDGIDDEEKKFFSHLQKGNLVVTARNTSGDKEKIYNSKKKKPNTKLMITENGVVKIIDEDNKTVWRIKMSGGVISGGGGGGGDGGNGESDKGGGGNVGGGGSKDGNAACKISPNKVEKACSKGAGVKKPKVLNEGKLICSNKFMFGPLNQKFVLCNKVTGELVWSLNASEPQLKFQEDGNLLFKDGTDKIKVSQTGGTNAMKLKITNAGVVQLVDENNESLWVLE